MSPDDAKQLISRISLGDRAAFSTLYDALSGRLFAVTLRVLRNRAEAEEALQDAFLNIWRRAASYDAERAGPMAWLVTIARNAAIDRMRRRREAADIDDLPERADEDAISPELAAMQSQEAAGLHACLEELTARESEMIRTAFMGGLTYSELAAREAKPLGTIKSTIRRSLLKLRHCLER
jgi:RNA polymerase sigma-70 factor (ECF subfamily)